MDVFAQRIHGLTPVATTYRPFGTNVLVTRRVSEGEAVSVVPFAYASVTFVLYSAGLKGCMVGWRLSWGGVWSLKECYLGQIFPSKNKTHSKLIYNVAEIVITQ